MKLIFLVVFALFVMQAVGGYFQIKNYQKSVHRVHQYGNVGIGQKRGRFFSGYLILIACDSDGVITRAEIMDGLTILAKFHEKKEYLGRPLIGSSIYDYLEEFAFMDKKQKKRNKGYIQAMEALSYRLNPTEEETKEEIPEDLREAAE